MRQYPCVDAGLWAHELGRRTPMAEKKKITPKAASGGTKQTGDRAAARVSQKKVLRKAARKSARKSQRKF